MLLKGILILIFQSQFVGFCLTESPISKYITPCHVEDPKLNDCLKNMFNDIMKHIGKGMRELNLPSLDPLFLEATLPINLNGFRVKYYDAFVRGFSNLSFTDARSNVAQYRIELKFKVPKVRISAQYEMSGRMLYFSYSGSGSVKSKFDEVEGIARIYGKLETRKSEDYMHIDRMKINYTYKNGHFDVQDEINPALSSFYTEQANSNLQKEQQSGRVSADPNMNIFFREVFQSVFSTIPIKSFLNE